MLDRLLSSKINWTQYVGWAAMALTVFKIDLPDDQKVQLVAALSALQGLATFVFRTWFNKPKA